MLPPKCHLILFLRWVIILLPYASPARHKSLEDDTQRSYNCHFASVDYSEYFFHLLYAPQPQTATPPSAAVPKNCPADSRVIASKTLHRCRHPPAPNLSLACTLPAPWPALRECRALIPSRRRLSFLDFRVQPNRAALSRPRCRV